MPPQDQPQRAPEVGVDFDAIIVGAGFAGMYMLHRLRGLGLHRARVYEAGSGVGGTWYWNRYPGARCDVESMRVFVLSSPKRCSRNGTGRERYAPQPEILRYANHVADRFDLRRDILFDTRVDARPRSTKPPCWRIETERRRQRVSANFCIMATGCLSAPNMSDFEGVEDFRGPSLPHRRMAASGGRLHRPARRRHRHRLVGRSSRSRSLPGRPRTSRCSSARRTTRYRPHNEPLTPEYRARDQSRLCRPARAAPGTSDRHRFPYQHRSPRSKPRRKSASANTKRRWQRGGLPFLGAYQRPAVRRAANDDRRRVRARQDPQHRQGSGDGRAAVRRTMCSAASACALIPATTRPSTGRT